MMWLNFNISFDDYKFLNDHLVWKDHTEAK